MRRVDDDFIGSQRVAWDAGKQVIAAAALAAAWLRAGRRMAPDHWRPALPVIEAAMRASGARSGPIRPNSPQDSGRIPPACLIISIGAKRSKLHWRILAQHHLSGLPSCSLYGQRGSRSLWAPCAAETKAPLADVLFVVRQQHWGGARATVPARTGLAPGSCLLPAWPAVAGALATALAADADVRGASAAAYGGGGAEHDALPLAQQLLLFPIEVFIDNPYLISCPRCALMKFTRVPTKL